MIERPTYKLRFPSTGPGIKKYLLFTEAVALMIETEDSSRPHDEWFRWIEPENTFRFLEAIGEQGHRPEFVNGEPTSQTKGLLRKIIKQFNSTDDLLRCWERIGIGSQSFHWRDSE